MNLKQMQQDFASAIFSSQAKVDVETASHYVQAQGDLTAVQRVGIYRNSAHGILNQHLEALYPVCRQLIGEARFVLLCDLFIDRQPPVSPYLTEFGACFVDFLAGYPELKSLAWIVDVTRLEWSRHAAWHTVNQSGSDFAELATFNEQQQAALRFALPQSAQLLHLMVRADEVWLAHQSTDAQWISDRLATVQLKFETHLVIWRQGRILQQSRLSVQQWHFLKAIEQGATLESLSEAFGEDIGLLLAEAVQQGWVYSFI